MAAYKPTQIIEYRKSGLKLTEDDIYWKRLDFPVTVKEFGAITALDFAPNEPFNLALTCSTKVQLYDSLGRKPTHSISRYKKSAYGGKFRRSDGQLLIAGGEEGLVKVFNVASRSQLRLFKAHSGPVHFCDFLADQKRIVSCSDDETVRVWDVTNEVELCCLKAGHNDYIRCGSVGNLSQDLFVSGSYDKTAVVWDLKSESKLASFDHGYPVEAVLLFPNDSLLLTAGGTVIKVWDLAAGSRSCLAQMSQHHKTITSLRFCTEKRRLMSSGLDRHIKIYDLGNYEVVHTLTYPAPILSFAISPDDNCLAVGMTSGLFSMQRRQAIESSEEKAVQRSSKDRLLRYKLRLDSFAQRISANSETTVVADSTKTADRKLPRYDEHLKKFRYTKALDVIFNSKYMMERRPEVVVSVIKQLIRLGALKRALAGRQYDTLAPLCRFLARHCSTAQFQRTIFDVIEDLVEIYGPNLGRKNADLLKQFRLVLNGLNREAEQLQQMSGAAGAIETLLTVANFANQKHFLPTSKSNENSIFGDPVVEEIENSE